LEKVDAACEAAGRDPSTLERSAAVIVEVGPHEPSAMTGPPLTGSPADIAAGLHDYADAGLSHVQIWLEPNTPAGIEAFARVLEELDRR
jgi:alkanesulfonate monooxygenase SsuD/methylene tetrahydromethanopterin reductase-like flavin-dependent oxidoreductase (luciferase family)